MISQLRQELRPLKEQFKEARGQVRGTLEDLHFMMKMSLCNIKRPGYHMRVGREGGQKTSGLNERDIWLANRKLFTLQ